MALALPSDTSPGLPVEALIAKAIEHGLSVEGLERLLAMRERLKAESAREAFFEALAAFQATCPVVPRRKVARIESSKGAYTYRYAPLDDIVEAVGPLLARHGLSYVIQARYEAEPPAQVASCVVHHVAGHAEASEFRAPIDGGARMNVVQQNATALTYAKRYAFCNALGILTGDEDVDGQGVGGDSRAPGRREAEPPPDDGLLAEIRSLNEQGPHWSSALLKGKLSRPNGAVVTKAELEALAAGARPSAGPEQGELL